MSTRAIVTAVNGGEKWSLYCHGDGYPAIVGRLVKNFAHLAPYIDVNNPKGREAMRRRMDIPFEVRRGAKVSGYQYMANTSYDPSKFIAALAAFMVQKGYSGVYMTDRDPIQEAKQADTDIDWYYLVNMNNGNPRVRAYRMEYWGPPKPLYRDESGKMHTIGSKQRFVEKKSLKWTEYSNPILRINPRYRRPARYWKVPSSRHLMLAETSKPISRKRAVRYGLPAMVALNPVRARNQKTVYMITPITKKAKSWVGQNVPLEPWQWMGKSFAVGWRYAGNLIEGMQNSGLKLNKDFSIS